MADYRCEAGGAPIMWTGHGWASADGTTCGPHPDGPGHAPAGGVDDPGDAWVHGDDGSHVADVAPLLACSHCGALITTDVTRTGPGGCWVAVDGTPCSHPAGHLPRHDDPPYAERMRPGY